VYQYFYEGQRAARRDGAAGIEFVFNVSSDRKRAFAVSVFVSGEALDGWQRAHDRQLGSTERYAVAKMSLFQAFDQRATPEALSEEVRVEAPEVESILATLDIS
jgi:hypothetical protein